MPVMDYRWNINHVVDTDVLLPDTFFARFEENPVPPTPAPKDCRLSFSVADVS
jgi:hypothetical protein